MALLSTKGIYGLMAIFKIAEGNEISPISIKEISDKIGVSKGYLEQILNLLRDAKIIESVKGKNGGYYLLKRPENLTFYEIFRALERGVSVANFEVKDAAFRLFFEDLDRQIFQILDIPITEFAKFKKESTEYLNFVI